MDALEKAIVLIDATRNELALGTKHYKDGKLLTTPLEILGALRDGGLMIEPTPNRQHLFGVKQ